MRVLALVLLLPLVCAQSSANSSATVVTSQSVSTVVTLGTNRQLSTFTTTTNFTTTLPLAASPSSSSNSTTNGTTSTSATTTQILPTAPSTIPGGTNAAPSPGQTGAGGQYGPGDGYIAAATSLNRNSFFVGASGIIVGGLLML